MESTPVLLQWLASTSPSTFLSLSHASLYLLGSVGVLFFKFPQAHAYPAMLSLALKVLPITNIYMALQPPPSRHTANSSSSRFSFELVQRIAAPNDCVFGEGLLNLESEATLHVTMSAEAQGLHRQLLVGPGTQAALLRLTAACRLLHSQHTAKQKQRQQGNCSSAHMGMAGASSRRCNRSSKPRNGGNPSCSSSSQTSNRSACQSAQDEAASLLLPPDHELVIVQCGERSVAALEAVMKKDCSRVDFASQISCCVCVLGESADARWQKPAALHVSGEPSCLGSAAGLQLLLEVIGLLVAEGNCTGTVQIDAFQLLLSSVTGVTEAEKRVFLAARGGLLVQVLRLGLQADWERQQQQQLEGVVDLEKGTMVDSALRTMAMLVAENLAAPSYGETGKL